MIGPEEYRSYSTSEVFALAENKDVEGLIGVLKYNNNKHVVKRAIFALGEIKDDKAVEPLVEIGLKSGLMTIWNASIITLGKIASKKAIIGLIAALDGELKEKVSEVLKEVGKPAVMPLIDSLSEANEPIIWETATILGEIRDKRAVIPLLILLLDPSKDEWERGYYVAMALGKIGDATAVEPLIQLASKHTEEMLTCMSVRALGDIGDYRAVEPLIAVLEDEGTTNCTHLRIETCQALGKIGDIRAVESLIRILRDTRNNIAAIRGVAASALVQFDDDRIELPLLQYYGGELYSMIAETSAEDMHLGALQGISKLITRLINKA